MSPRAKAQLYHSLAQLLRAGITFPRALEKLSRTLHGSARRTAAKIRAGIDSGDTVAEACAAADLGSVEASVLTAVERAGFLDRGLEQLAHHFTAVASARGRILAKLAYPAFVLVLCVLLLNLPLLVRENLDAYLLVTLPTLAAVAGCAAVLAIVCKFLGALAAVSPLVESFVRLVPLAGGMQRAFAMSRFCMAYELQLNAGINVFDALASAGLASRSALVRRAVARALPEVRAGSQVGPLLETSRAFDPDVPQAIIVGEESGTLGSELRRLAEAQAARAYARLETLAEWLPRLIYLAVMVYVGWSIVRVYRDYLGQLMKLIDGV
ncbi:MAG: type II secretion system F family protein [Chthoniobacteraceae bacterium]